MKKFSLRFLMISLGWIGGIFPLQAQSANVVETLQKYQDYTYHFLLPVNVWNQKINVSVTIPQDFKVLNQSPGHDLLEFIPISDQDANAWSEIITVKPYIGQKFRAKQILKSIVSGIRRSVPQFSILEEEQKEAEYYQNATSVLRYVHQNREELLEIYAISGPFDAATIQYAIHIKHVKDLPKARQKMALFFRNNVKIIEDSK